MAPESNPLVFFESAGHTLIPLSVFIAGILGSHHCVAMCGGLASSLGKSQIANLTYQFGRLFGYLALGALAACLGGQFMNSTTHVYLQIGSSLLIAAVLVR